MAQKDSTISGKGRNPGELLVQKSNPLLGLWRSNLTLAEFKILDTYLARIDSHHPEKRTVIFERGEIEELLGVTRLMKKDLAKRLKHLSGAVVDLECGDENVYDNVTLFERARAVRSDGDLWQVQLMCTESAMKYMFNVEQLGYLRYKLRSVINITSRYSYVMFTYLESNRRRGSWDVDLDKLKFILACDDEETYKEYKRFNDLLLKKVKKELDEKTDCHFTYTPIKKGRRIVALHIELESIAVQIRDPEDTQMDLDDYQNYVESALPLSCELWKSALVDKQGNPVFTDRELDVIAEHLYLVPEHLLPTTQEGSIDIRRHHFMAQMYAYMMAYDEKKPIRNKLSYILALINDAAGV